jgi:hypothetical protein
MNRYVLPPNSKDKSLAKRLKNYFHIPIVYLPNLTVFEAGLDELELIFWLRVSKDIPILSTLCSHLVTVFAVLIAL